MNGITVVHVVVREDGELLHGLHLLLLFVFFSKRNEAPVERAIDLMVSGIVCDPPDDS